MRRCAPVLSLLTGQDICTMHARIRVRAHEHSPAHTRADAPACPRSCALDACVHLRIYVGVCIHACRHAWGAWGNVSTVGSVVDNVLMHAHAGYCSLYAGLDTAYPHWILKSRYAQIRYCIPTLDTTASYMSPLDWILAYLHRMPAFTHTAHAHACQGRVQVLHGVGGYRC